MDALVVVEGDLVSIIVEEGEVAQLPSGELAAGVALVGAVDSGLILVDQVLNRDGIIGSMNLGAPGRESQEKEKQGSRPKKG